MERLTRKQAIEKHITECKHRMEVIDERMNHPDADIEACNKNIFILQTVVSELKQMQQLAERDTAKRPIKASDETGIRYTDSYRCPNCGKSFTGTGIADFCYHCG